MKSERLALWLQDHTEMLGNIADDQDQAFHSALYESIIDVALHGETIMIDSVSESSAAHAVATGRKLTDLLGVTQRLRERIWQRIEQEIDPEPAFVMLSAIDAIFIHVIKVTIDAYTEGTNLAYAAKSTEISRLYTDSEKKVMEYAAEVARANRELARLEEAKTDFIGIAAHELKTPLTLIQGYVNILHDESTEVEVRSAIDGLNRGVARMNTIIEDMLDLSEIDLKQLKLVLEEVKLDRTIKLVLTQLDRAILQREQSVETVDLDALPKIEADGRRLHQIFKQIVNNAIKYTPDGGQITITGQAITSAQLNADCVRIIVNDSGVGIAPEDQDKVFEKFYRVGDASLHSSSQTKFMGAGPGLGLAIVKGLTEAHGGFVTADSPGFDTKNYPGASFSVTLPLRANPPAGINVERLSPG